MYETSLLELDPREKIFCPLEKKTDPQEKRFAHEKKNFTHEKKKTTHARKIWPKRIKIERLIGPGKILSYPQQDNVKRWSATRW